jgi:hypothetical protein
MLGLSSSQTTGARAQGETSHVLELPQQTPIPTICPDATPEPPPLVDPLISPTNLFNQTLTVHYHISEAITVTGESGAFSLHEGDEHWAQPALVDIRLLRNTIHHLTVTSKVPEYYNNGCYYHGYTLDTQVDSNGDPLVIEQVSPPLEYKFFLPVFIRTGSIQE